MVSVAHRSPCAETRANGVRRSKRNRVAERRIAEDIETGIWFPYCRPQVQVAFDIDTETHERILNQALQQPYITPELEAYSSVLKTALIDGIITSDESAMLETLRKTTGVSDQEHAMLLAELQDAIEG